MSEPKIGDTRVRNGRVWQLYEIELEGEKWMDMGPALLRQEPSVEEIARVIRETIDIWANGEITGSHKAAEAIRELWRRAEHGVE